MGKVEFVRQDPDHLFLRETGSPERGLFFITLGVLFEVLFVYGYWSLLDATGQWSWLWQTTLESELLPFTPLLLLFGGGCVLAGLKELFWQEIWLVQRSSATSEPIITRTLCFGSWRRETVFRKKFITRVELRTIPLDSTGSYLRYRLEFDVQQGENEPKEWVLFEGDGELGGSDAYQIARATSDILGWEGVVGKKRASDGYQLSDE